MTSAVADLLTCALAMEIAASEVRVFAVTTPASVAAALAARELGALDLAIAIGFTSLDASPTPNVTLGEGGLSCGVPQCVADPLDTFTLLARGQLGVAVAPAQLDAQGQTNLSAIGDLGKPKVALPGARGLPDNNASSSRIWYLMAAHTPRQLVARVDVVCGAVPPPSAARSLLTPAGCFELGLNGWVARWLTPAAPELIAQTPGLRIRLSGHEPVRDAPEPVAIDAVRRADPHGARMIEFASGAELATLYAAAASRESLSHPGR